MMTEFSSSTLTMSNTTSNTSLSVTIVDYNIHDCIQYILLFMAFLCVLINLTIVLKLIFKPKLWSFVNLFLTLLLGGI